MSNRFGLHTITTDVILDDTIIDADVKSNANITRSKMNQAQDLIAKTGAKLQVLDASDTKDIQIIHDGTYGKIAVLSGDLLNEIVTGILRLYKAGVHSEINVHAGDFGRRLRIYFDGTNFNINFSSGDLIFDCQANLIFNKNVAIKTGKNLLVYGAGGVNYVTVYHNDTAGYIHSSLGALKLSSVGNEIVIWRAGVTMALKVYDSAQSARVSIYHTAAGGFIDNNVGDLTITPQVNLNLANKPITNVNDFTFNAIKTGFNTFNASLFRGQTTGDEAFRGIDGGSYGLRNTDGAFARHDFFIPLNLPQGVIITGLRVYYKRNDAASTSQVWIEKIDHATQAATTRGIVMLNDVTGAIVFVEDTTMLAEQVNNAAYGYFVRCFIDNNDAVTDIVIVGVYVQYTYQKIYC